MAYASLKDHARAAEGLLAVLQYHPHDPKVLKELADVYHASEQVDKAVALLEGYLENFRGVLRRRTRRKEAAGGDGDVMDKQDGAAGEFLDLNLVNVLCELYLLTGQHDKLIKTIEVVDAMPADVLLGVGSDEGATDEEGGSKLPIDLTVKFGIAHLHAQHKEQALVLFDVLHKGFAVTEYADLYFDVAEAFVACGKKL